ncbi:dihydropteroate synthase [Thiohalomonas denitrificans]|uniref:dihydropteroate synthase n=1 Tax=Thiohalomonas denitrificans TaxID=415747 RepID=UPI0026EA5871|nr:dihydropteroate synthase [Thiohalomonas denitrificans]
MEYTQPITTMHLDCAGKPLDLSFPRAMGILNVTPDSFSDGGLWRDSDSAVAQGRRMAAAGAAVIDVGGESTRPGSEPVSVQEELERVIPVIERLSAELPIPISIDTSKPEVMREAVRAGAGMINDVLALRREHALATAAELNVPVCLMHMQGEPRTMQATPQYRDVVGDVFGFLADRIADCEAGGISRERIVVDPGFGFGKTLPHNLELLRNLPRLLELGTPVMVGLSRKSMIGAVLENAPVERRLHGSIAAASLSAWLGARLLRVHDVEPTVDALRVVTAAAGV